MFLDSLDFIKDKVSENDFILFNKIYEFFEEIDYTDHQDDIEYLISIVDNIESPLETITNTFALHLNKLGSYLGLDFNVASQLSQRLEFLKVIDNIKNIDKTILLDTRDDYNLLDNNYDKLQLIYDDLTDSVIKINIYELTDSINKELLDYIDNIFDFKETKNMDELIEEAKMNKKLSVLKKLEIPVDTIIKEYFKNNPDHIDIEITSILFREYLDGQTYNLKSSVLTLLVLSNGDIIDNFKILSERLSIKINTLKDIVEKIKVLNI